MGEAIGKILFVIIALIVIASVGSLVLSVLGLALTLIPLLIKIAIIGGLIYLALLVIRKLTGPSAQPF
ncbi:MAG TPA: hypothetical protein PLD20_16175 [Blastocatellia bacterium]|nr:hypothetical protein [Blastocatellia bacterium]HMV86772.1 hypothetical protein [Blastocatellia bacterium]HMX25646.1 hypothetical protein [Blastocatellia bacterium]HMY71173.1 hypothetical protein [Blastocatellia bacterium]HMZ19476.1 hypothetical protein [Blastocatellia bacterium]